MQEIRRERDEFLQFRVKEMNRYFTYPEWSFSRSILHDSLAFAVNLKSKKEKRPQGLAPDEAACGMQDFVLSIQPNSVTVRRANYSFVLSDGGGLLKTVPFDSSSLIHLTYLSSASRRPLLRPLLNCHFLTVSVNAPAMSSASMVKKEMTTEKTPMSVISCT